METAKVISEVIGITDDLENVYPRASEDAYLVAAAIIQNSIVMISNNEDRDKMLSPLIGILNSALPLMGTITGVAGGIKNKFCTQNLKSCADFKLGTCLRKEACEFKKDTPDLG